MKKCIEHAKNKGADIALIYDANKLFHRDNIDDGMKEYMKHNAKSPHQTVKLVITVNSKKEVHYWTFDK